MDRAIQLLGEAEHLAEPKPCSLPETFGREEGLEYPLHHFGGHPTAAIADAQGDMLALQAFWLALQDNVVRCNPKRAAVGHCVARVEGEVEQHELERSGVRVDGPQLIGDFGDQLDVAAQRRAKKRRDVGEEVLELNLLDLE